MARYAASIGGARHHFESMAALLASASSPKTGDVLAGIAAESEVARVCARYALADLPLKTFLQDLVVPYEQDDVSRLIVDTHDAESFRLISALTVGSFREWLLAPSNGPDEIRHVARGLTPEMVAAVSKIMRNQDLIAVARKCSVVTRFRTTLGLPGTLAARLQPNHPMDDIRGVLAATVDGLTLGCGDALIGVNPVTDSLPKCRDLLLVLDEFRERYSIPTQNCVLTHVTNALALIERGAPTDIVFQSIAGSQAANQGFGVTLDILTEARDAALSLRRGTIGDNVMYFETGQGSALSSNAHFGVDQQTMEARTYGVARAYSPFMVNTVVGFIGPEYIDGSSQLIRAGLEDYFCGKLLGLPMGCDVCYTTHASIDQNDMDTLATLLAVANIAFLIAVPGAEDVMLNYQSLSFHDILYLRQILQLEAAPEFVSWMDETGISDSLRGLPAEGDNALLSKMMPIELKDE